MRIIEDNGVRYSLSEDAYTTLMAHGLLVRVGEGTFRLSTEEELIADPGSAGVNHPHPAAVIGISRAMLATLEVVSSTHEFAWDAKRITHQLRGRSDADQPGIYTKRMSEEDAAAAAMIDRLLTELEHYQRDSYMEAEEPSPAAPTA